jgi:hypothetical protein
MMLRVLGGTDEKAIATQDEALGSGEVDVVVGVVAGPLFQQLWGRECAAVLERPEGTRFYGLYEKFV